MTRIGVYPGSFNPPTIAHLAIADAARRQRRLHRVELVLSRVTLAKEHVELPLLEHRVAVLEQVGRRVPWLGVRVTEAQLLADIAEGYDVVVMGADKWAQVNDPRYYGSVAARDAALAALPDLAIAPRAADRAGARGGTVDVAPQHALAVAPEHEPVSSSAVRAGTHDWMSPAAAEFDRRTGAWSDPARYDRWCEEDR